MKTAICTAAGIVGGAIAAALGGWDFAVKALLICMAVDYASGWVVAAVFHKSPKTETGSLASGVGLVGLARKAMMFAFVVIGNLMDQILSVAYLRDAIIIGFMCNEILSIIENAGLMGLPLPAVVTKAVDILSKQATETAEIE